MKLALLVEYNGSEYHGFQYQKNVASVQGTIEEAIFNLTGEPTRIKGAGRTDSGVPPPPSLAPTALIQMSRTVHRNSREL